MKNWMVLMNLLDFKKFKTIKVKLKHKARLIKNVFYLFRSFSYLKIIKRKLRKKIIRKIKTFRRSLRFSENS